MRNIKFYKTVYRPYPPLMFSLFDLGYFNKPVWTKFLGFPYRTAAMLYVDGVVYYTTGFMTIFVKNLTQKLFSNKNYLKHLKKETLLLEKKILSCSQKKFPEFYKDYSGYIPTIGIYHVCDDRIENKIRTELLKKLALKEVEEIMHYLNLPLQNNISLQERMDLIRTKNLSQHVKKYYYLNCRFGKITPYTLAQAKKKKAELIKENFLAHCQRDKKNTRKMIARAEKNLAPKYKHLPEVMQFFIYYRTHRTDVVNMIFRQYYPQLKKLAKERGITYQELLYCLVPEILEDNIPSKTELKKRMSGFSLLATPTKETIYTGAKHQAIYKKYNPKQKQVAQFKGNTANPGLAKGKVVIVKNIKDLKKVKPGNILVASMTTPVMVPAMQKAAAIITNEGGITCHASILARELKKPCVIGTGIATQVLKTGDMVKVDANKGIIKKI